MSASALPSPDQFHADEQTLSEYSAVSRPAIAALLLGLASALMLVSPLLVLIPLAASAAGIVALRKISASGGQLTGRWPATIGLCLAVLFAGLGFSRQWTRQSMLIEHAQQYTEGWLRLCQDGKLQRAEQLMHPPQQRLNSDAAIEEFYRTNKEAGEAVESIFTSEPMKSFLALGKDGVFELSIAGQSHSGFTDEIFFKCVYGNASGTGETKTFWVSAARTLDPASGLAGWRIRSAEHDPPPEIR